MECVNDMFVFVVTAVVALAKRLSVASSTEYSVAPVTAAQAIVYGFPASPVDGPETCGTPTLQATDTTTVAVADRLPNSAGRVAVIVADPADAPATEKSIVRDPAGMT